VTIDSNTSIKKIRVSKKFENEWDFYSNNEWLDFLSGNIKSPPYSKNGYSAKEALFIFDSQGKMESCREVELFIKMLNRKSNINMQIKMWVDGFMYVLEPVDELMKTFIGDVPKWVQIALENQLVKRYGDRYNFMEEGLKPYSNTAIMSNDTNVHILEEYATPELRELIIKEYFTK